MPSRFVDKICNSFCIVKFCLTSNKTLKLISVRVIFHFKWGQCIYQTTKLFDSMKKNTSF